MDKKLKTLVVLIPGLTPLVIIPYVNDPTNLPKLIWIFLATALLLGYNIREKLFRAWNTFIIPALLLLFWNLFTLHRCVNIYAGLYAVLMLFLFITFYITMENLMASDTTQIHAFIRNVVIVSVIVSLYGLLQLTGFDFLPWELKHSPLSTLGRRNFAAEYLVMIIPYALYLARSAKQKKERILNMLLMLLFIVHLAFTFTRASYIAFFFSMLFFLLAVRSGKKIPSQKTAAVMLLLLLVSVPLSCSSTTFEKGTVKSRFLIWNITFKMIRHNPVLGVGPGNFTILYPFYTVNETQALHGESLNTGHVHNDYLETAAEGGIPELLFFLYLLFAAAGTFAKLHRKAGQGDRLLITAAAASLVAICVNALAAFPFRNAATSLLFWSNLSFLGALQRSPERPKRMAAAQPMQAYLAIFVLTGLVLSWRAVAASRSMFKAKHSVAPHSILFAEDSLKYNPFSFENAHFAGTEALNAGQYQKAHDCLLQAEKLHPYFDSIHNNLGMVYMLTGNYNESEESFLKALMLNPDSPKFNNNLGFLYVNMGKTDKAIGYLQKAVSLEPDFYLAHFSLGLAYYIKGDYPEAETHFRTALELNPAFRPAREYLDKIGPSG